MPSTRKKAQKQKTPRTRKKPKTIKLQKMPKGMKYDTRPKKEAVVEAHSRTVSGRTVLVREHVRIVVGGKVKQFKVTSEDDCDNAELFKWKEFKKIEHLHPTIVEMSPADFLFLTADYQDPEYSADFEMSHPEKFDEQTEKSDKLDERRVKLVDKYARRFEKLKKTHFVVLTIGKDGRVERHSPDSRERAQALKEIGCAIVPIVVIMEVK